MPALCQFKSNQLCGLYGKFWNRLANEGERRIVFLSCHPCRNGSMDRALLLNL
jgi:hypothetical protein